MKRSPLHSIAVAMIATFALLGTSEAAPLTLPFDFSRYAILLEVAARDTPLKMLLATGASVSTIDTARAESLKLKIDYARGGKAPGEGNATQVIVNPTSIDDLVIGGRRFGSVEAVTLDMKAISSAYLSPVDGLLGYSFLTGKQLLIDYPAKTVTIFDKKTEAASQLSACRKVWRSPLRSFEGDHIPIVELKIGSVRMPVSIDTGNNGTVELFKKALDNPTMTAALVETGTSTYTGNNGAYNVKTHHLNAPISLGPFTLPAGLIVTLSGNGGSAKTRLASVGNRLLAAMKLKLLLDYPENELVFLGDCAP